MQFYTGKSRGIGIWNKAVNEYADTSSHKLTQIANTCAN